MAQASAESLPTKGSLKRTPFAKLMRALDRASATGSLYLLQGDTKKVVFFQDGTPVFVRSNVLDECLGQILAAEGLITQAQCDQTLEAIRRTGKKQGELLVEMGILSQGNLRYGLEAQLRRKLFDIFTWEDGRFQFKAGPGKQEHKLGLDTNTAQLIIGGILEAANHKAAEEALGMYQGRFPLARKESQKSLGLLPNERHFFARLDGSRSSEDIVSDEGADAREETVLLLHALISSGAVMLPKEPRDPAPAPDAPEDHSARSDDEFAPGYEARQSLKGYEDTPLPGALPKAPAEISGADVDMDEEFDSVAAEHSEITPMAAVKRAVSAQIDQALIDAEPDGFEDDAFDAEIEVIEDGELELIEEDDLLEELDEQAIDPTLAAAATELDQDGLEIDDDLVMDAAGLMDLDELDDIELGGALGDAAVPAGEDAEMVGAMRYAEGEAAIQAGAWEAGTAALETAYELGVDMAELHAMLAYGRFKTAEQDPEMQQHALELLEYAESMNPNLDAIFAYRGEIYLVGGHLDAAREAIDQALHLNEYNDLAMQLMDRLG